MSIDIKMDLYADFAALCGVELQNAGYAPSGGDNTEIIRSYANVRNRRVSQRVRRVHKAPYIVPTHLILGEQNFLAAVEIGADLRPYQSTRLEDATFNDGMLNDFGIHHFHLGTTPYPKNPAFMDRTEPLLFALVREDDFYSLGCHAHGDWSKTLLLDILESTWPDVMSSTSLHGTLDSSTSVPSTRLSGLAHLYNDDEIKKLRNKGINVVTQRPGGAIQAGLGGGVTTNGRSARVALEVASIKRMCLELERELKHVLTAKLSSVHSASTVKLRLQQRGDRAFVAVEGAEEWEFDLGVARLVPPL